MQPIIQFSFSVLLLFAAPPYLTLTVPAGLPVLYLRVLFDIGKALVLGRPLDFREGQPCLSERYETVRIGR
jgi:hypothetical protein